MALEIIAVLPSVAVDDSDNDIVVVAPAVGTSVASELVVAC